MDEQIFYVVALTTAITEALKRATPDPTKRYIPIMSMGVGIVVNIVITGFQWQNPQTYLNGIIGGLSASGFYDLSKKTILNK